MLIHDKEQLVNYVSHGHPVEFIYFWGPEENGEEITRACLCQWYYAPFTVEGVVYPTTEHYMMAEKARLFADEAMRERIITAPEPADAQMLGRHVKQYDEATWQRHRFSIVVAGNLAKFSQNPRLLAYLLGTGNKVLVEASPLDAIWGVGMMEQDPAITTPAKWKGLNLLGFALMDVRYQLRTPQK